MFKNFNKQIVHKTTIKWEIINSIISSIVWAIVLYIILLNYSDMLIDLLEVSKGKELEMTYIMFPIIIIFNIMYTLVKIAFNGDLDKKGRRKK